MKLSKQELKQIIKEELKLVVDKAEVEEHEMYTKDDELREIGANIADLLKLTKKLRVNMTPMQVRYGHLAHMGAYIHPVESALKTFSTKYKDALDNVVLAAAKGPTK